MDCEGAELDILQNMSKAPRVLIVEVHPQRYSRAEEVIDVLVERGYRIEERRRNTGEALTGDQFAQVLTECDRGEAPAPIVTARYVAD